MPAPENPRHQAVAVSRAEGATPRAALEDARIPPDRARARRVAKRDSEAPKTPAGLDGARLALLETHRLRATSAVSRNSECVQIYMVDWHGWRRPRRGRSAAKARPKRGHPAAIPRP
jgi:hypothetical protein